MKLVGGREVEVPGSVGDLCAIDCGGHDYAEEHEHEHEDAYVH